MHAHAPSHSSAHLEIILLRQPKQTALFSHLNLSYNSHTGAPENLFSKTEQARGRPVEGDRDKAPFPDWRWVIAHPGGRGQQQPTRTYCLACWDWEGWCAAVSEAAGDLVDRDNSTTLNNTLTRGRRGDIASVSPYTHSSAVPHKN